MPKFLADEGVRRSITLQLRNRGVDIVTAQESDLTAATDTEVLAWAAGEGRIVVTDDVATMPDCAAERLRAGDPMPGLILARQSLPVGVVVEDIHVIAACGDDDEFENRIAYLPL